MEFKDLTSNISNLSTQYLYLLQKDIENNEQQQSKIGAGIEEIQTLLKNVQTLSHQPEWTDSFIPINNLAYIPGTIIHTGEHYVKLGMGSYTLMSLSETTNYLQRQLRSKEELLQSYRERQSRIQQYCGLYKHDELDVDTTNMPEKISSHRGVAYKTINGAYEIFEPYDEEVEKLNQVKKAVKTRNKEMENDNPEDYFKNLEKLEQQEFLNEELTDCAPRDISKRIKNILRNNGVYTKILSDETIQQQCNFTLDNELILNKLIVDALIKEPVSYCSDEEIPPNSINDNELKVVKFLDEIESDVKILNI